VLHPGRSALPRGFCCRSEWSWRRGAGLLCWATPQREGTAAAMGLCLTERCPAHDACRQLVRRLPPVWTPVLLCPTRAGAVGLAHTAPATCLVPSPREQWSCPPHPPLLSWSEVPCVPWAKVEVAVWLGTDRARRKAGDRGHTMSSVRRGRQDTASASPGLHPLPTHGLCTRGRKWYALLPILIKPTDNLLFSKEQYCCSEKLKDYDL